MNVGGLEGQEPVEVHTVVSLKRVIGKLQMPLELKPLLGNLSDYVLELLAVLDCGLGLLFPVLGELEVLVLGVSESITDNFESLLKARDLVIPLVDLLSELRLPLPYP